MVDIRRVESLWIGRRPAQGLTDTQAPGHPTSAIPQIRHPSGNAPENLIEHQKNGHLGKQGQATAHWVDVVGLVEGHHLLVKSFPVSLVASLDLLQLRPQVLHLDHRPGALKGHRR